MGKNDRVQFLFGYEVKGEGGIQTDFQVFSLGDWVKGKGIGNRIGKISVKVECEVRMFECRG